MGQLDIKASVYFDIFKFSTNFFEDGEIILLQFFHERSFWWVCLFCPFIFIQETNKQR